MRIQIVADLRALSDLSMNGAVRHLTSAERQRLNAALSAWRDHRGSPAQGCAKVNMRLEGLARVPEGEALWTFVDCAIARFVHRNRFDEISAPAFLA